MNISVRRTVATTTMAVGLIIGAVALGAPAIAAGPVSPQLLSCQASTCTGKDPQAYTCSQDAETVRTASREGSTIELRYSPSCRAAWAREVNGVVGDFLWVRNSAGTQETAHINSGTSNFTLMVNDANLTSRACMTLVGETTFTCTGSF